MVTFLSGGTGTPKLLWGADAAFDMSTATIIANTGDDIDIGGLFVCPDLDTVLYERAGELHRTRWWGIENDTHHTHQALHRLAGAFDRGSAARYLPDERQTGGRDLSRWRRFAALPEFMTLGDRDRALAHARSSLLDDGLSLTEITEQIAAAYDVAVELLPMSNDPVASMIHTPNEVMHFQEYWVDRGGEPQVDDVEFRGSNDATPTEAVMNALTDRVVIGPSNPVTSLGPLLSLAGVESALEASTVVAVSPFIDEDVFSGPAAELMAAIGLPASTAGVAQTYGFADAFVIDTDDSTAIDRPVVQTDTSIDQQSDAKRVARAVTTALEMVE